MRFRNCGFRADRAGSVQSKRVIRSRIYVRPEQTGLLAQRPDAQNAAHGPCGKALSPIRSPRPCGHDTPAVRSLVERQGALATEPAIWISRIQWHIRKHRLTSSEYRKHRCTEARRAVAHSAS